MDDQLLRELYGVDAENDYTESDDMIKEAQAELVEAVAEEAGVDLNEMDDDELEKFASYVLSSDSYEDGYIEDDAYAQADQMGRVMAHAYADEQMKIASLMEEEAMMADMYGDIADSWEMAKIARKGADFAGYGGRDGGMKVGDEFGELTNRQKMQIGRRRFGKDGDNARKTLQDMGIRKRDYLRALAGRATGFYDLSTARNLNKQLRDLKNTMPEKEYKDLMKEVREARKAKGSYGGASRTARANLRAYAMRNKRGLDRNLIDQIAAAQDARRGLALRGGGKMALTAAGLGALGYGASRAMDNK